MPRWTRTGAIAATTLALAAGALVPIALAPATEAATAISGVDVSSWQHPNGVAADINWTKVAAGGQSFAIIKATESTTYKNPYYAADVANARAAGLVVGAYHFARPKLPLSSAADQAKYFVKATGTMRTANTLPPVLDLEATGGLSTANTVAWAKTFLSTVKSLTGRTPMIYSYKSFLTSSLGNTTQLSGYPLWYACYSSQASCFTNANSPFPKGWGTWTIWQYSSGATVSGLKGDIDVNRFNGSRASLLALADGTKAAPISPGAPTNLAATLTYPDAKLTWSAPTSTGGSPITNYLVSVDGGAASSTPTRAYVAGPLAVGTHTISVRAVTIAGTSAAASTTVTLSPPQVGSSTPPPATSTVALASATTVWRGLPTPVTVTLRRADTLQTVGGEYVTVKVAPIKGAATKTTLVTNSYGVATATFYPRANGTLSVTYGGDARLTPAAASQVIKVRPRPLAKLSKTTVKRNVASTVTANLHTVYAGETVRLQRYYSGAWHLAAKTKVTSAGTVSYSVKSKGIGTYKYRVHVDASTLHLAGDSKTLTLTVKK